MTKFTVHASDFDGVLRELLKRCRNFTSVMKVFGQYWVTSFKENFIAQGRPVKWRPLKVNTIVARFLSRGSTKAREAAKNKSGGQFAPNPRVFGQARPGRGGGAVSTVAGFRRNKAGSVARSRHAGYNKVAATGMAFKKAFLKFHGQAQILRDSGQLMNSISATAGKSSVEVGTNKLYAATHQFGDSKRGIVARPFAVVQDEDPEHLQGLVADYLAGAWGR